MAGQRRGVSHIARNLVQDAAFKVSNPSQLRFDETVQALSMERQEKA